jgi:hypothetical protein
LPRAQPPKLDDRPLSAVLNLLFSIFGAGTTNEGNEENVENVCPRNRMENDNSGKLVRRCEDNIKIESVEIGCEGVDWIKLA